MQIIGETANLYMTCQTGTKNQRLEYRTGLLKDVDTSRRTSNFPLSTTTSRGVFVCACVHKRETGGLQPTVTQGKRTFYSSLNVDVFQYQHQVCSTHFSSNKTVPFDRDCQRTDILKHLISTKVKPVNSNIVCGRTSYY